MPKYIYILVIRRHKQRKRDIFIGMYWVSTELKKEKEPSVMILCRVGVSQTLQTNVIVLVLVGTERSLSLYPKQYILKISTTLSILIWKSKKVKMINGKFKELKI